MTGGGDEPHGQRRAPPASRADALWDLVGGHRHAQLVAVAARLGPADLLAGARRQPASGRAPPPRPWRRSAGAGRFAPRLPATGAWAGRAVPWRARPEAVRAPRGSEGGGARRV